MDKVEDQITELLATGDYTESELEEHLRTAQKIRIWYQNSVAAKRQEQLKEWGDDILEGKDVSFLLMIVIRELGRLSEIALSDDPDTVKRAQEGQLACVEISATLMAISEMLATDYCPGEGAVVPISRSTQPEIPFIAKGRNE